MTTNFSSTDPSLNSTGNFYPSYQIVPQLLLHTMYNHESKVPHPPPFYPSSQTTCLLEPGFLTNPTSLIITKVVLNPFPMCMCQKVGRGRWFLYQQVILKCQQGVLQVNLIMILSTLEIASDSTLGPSPLRLPSTSNVNLKPWLFCTYDQLAINQRFLWPPGFN